MSFSERAGPAYWHDYKDGKLDKQQFAAWMAPVREQFEAELRRAAAAEHKGVSGSCANILEHQPALWTIASPGCAHKTS